MNVIPPEQSNAGSAPASTGVDAAMSAMGAALANREAVMKSLAESRAQVFKLLEAKREKVLGPIVGTKELLRQAQASAGAVDTARPALTRQDSTSGVETVPDDPRLRLCRTFTNSFTVLAALQGAGGVAADDLREQAAARIVDALVGLVEEEVNRILRR